MNFDRFRAICLGFPLVSEEFPFGPETVVYKVGGKIFALAGIDLFESINLKCDPEKALELREAFEAVKPGYHMNKKHWNTVLMDHSIPDKTINGWIEESYQLVAAKLPGKKSKNK
ncbi:MAG TPA: MmcQ/YjbR family DNA-binding protein [Flavihumibacter sp.]|nr:MmcQ/YjbR family DNA-binding protein [Flavihumibacter sp.]HQD10036.1 MmcQ/YjbR family DNA-binding protein [Flavihumibacter sp.]